MLLITAETYSKYISPEDRSLRTIFGDGAAATLVEAHTQPSVSAFRFGTDGAGADTLMVTRGGAREASDALKPRKRHRWASQLYMDGPALVDFTVERIPQLVDEILAAEKLDRDGVELFLMHQATHLMLARLRERLEVDEQKLPLMLENCGNTVSSTLPILLHELRSSGRLRPGTRSMLVGFGVGLSWAGCLWTETWAAKGAATADKPPQRPTARQKKPTKPATNKPRSAISASPFSRRARSALCASENRQHSRRNAQTASKLAG